MSVRVPCLGRLNLLFLVLLEENMCKGPRGHRPTGTTCEKGFVGACALARRKSPYSAPPWALLEWVSMNVSLGASPGRLPLVTEGYVSACALALTLILVLRMRSSSLVLS